MHNCSGVAGHFVGYMPWATCDEVIQPLMASIVGKSSHVCQILVAFAHKKRQWHPDKYPNLTKSRCAYTS